MRLDPETVRDRLRRVLGALSPEDLEERVAPVKCNKHPDHSECMDVYGAPRYAAPEPPGSAD
jgi:hypothetical protein